MDRRPVATMRVVLTHPLHESEDLLGIPEEIGERVHLAEERAWIARSALNVRVDALDQRERRFPAEDIEAHLAYEVIDHTQLDGVDLMSPMRHVAEADHLGGTDHRAQRKEIGRVRPELRGVQDMRICDEPPVRCRLLRPHPRKPNRPPPRTGVEGESEEEKAENEGKLGP